MAQNLRGIDSTSYSKAAPTYAPSVGPISSVAAARLLQLTTDLAPDRSPTSDNSSVIDVGAGTGAVALAVASQNPLTLVTAVDVSASMLALIDAQKHPNITTRVLDARELVHELPEETYTHAFSTFMLQFMTTPLKAIQEMHSLLGPAGIIGIALWAQRNDPLEIWEKACQSIDPSYKRPSQFDDPNAWTTREELEQALENAGFEDILSEEVKIPTPASIEDLSKAWFASKNPALERVISSWNGSMEQAKEAMAEIIKNEYEDGKTICSWAILGVAKKKQVPETNQTQ